MDWLQEARQRIARSEYSWSLTTDGTYSAPNRAQGLRSRIGADGIELFPREIPASGVGAPWMLRLETVRFGYEGEERPIGASRLAHVDARIHRYAGALDEWYVNDERGIEQGWTIPGPPASGPSIREGRPLRIELAAEGLRAQVAADGRSAVFVDEDGELRLRYFGLRSWDATGRELEASFNTTPGGLAVEVQTEGALYPITVDPVLAGPVWTAEGNQADSVFGWSVSGAGDVNGDGFDDVIAGAFSFDGGQTDEGRAFLYFGSASGPSLAPDWTAESDQASAWLGFDVSGAGDVNGDGFDDVLVGVPLFDDGQTNEGRAFLYFGSASGPSLAPDWTVESDQTSAYLGWRLSGAGDVNGDGFEDVIVGAPEFDNGQTNEGRAFLYLGSASGPSLAPDWTAEGDQLGAFFGWSVSGAGDVNGDGFDDVVVGAYLFDDPQPEEGRSFLYLGSPSGPSLAADWTAEGDQAGAFFGRSVSGAGDVNGDGFDDVIVGASLFDNGQTDEGRAFLYLGSPSGLSLAPTWTAESEQGGATFGESVSGAGDVNGDGFDDVIVGASAFDDGQLDEGSAFLYLGSASGPSLTPSWTAGSDQAGAFFGQSVSGAGDVNGDGFDDVVVGAPGFDNGQSDEGRSFLYLGQDFTDCNGNGIDDADDVTNGTSADVNGNGVPDECEAIGTSYCTANPNSTGSPADLLATGSASSSAGDLTLDAAPVPNQPGIFFHGANQSQIPFGNGFRCASGGIERGAVVFAAGNLATYTYDNSDAKHDLSTHVGSNRNFQYWYRDPMGGGAGFNTSDAVSIDVLP